MDFWEKIASYKPRWQAGDGRKAQLPTQFFQVLIGNLADLYVFSEYVDANLSSFREDFDGSAFATHVEEEDPMTVQGSNKIKVYQSRVEVPWITISQLREAVELVI